jgi:hypothetical protein
MREVRDTVNTMKGPFSGDDPAAGPPVSEPEPPGDPSATPSTGAAADVPTTEPPSSNGTSASPNGTNPESLPVAHPAENEHS